MRLDILRLFSVSSLVLLTATGGALAASFSSDLEVTSSVGLSRTDATGAVSQTGEIRTTEGGTTTISAFTTTPPATTPLTGTLTDTGDGIGWGTDLDAGSAIAEYDFLVDFLVNLKNTSLTDTYTVTVKAKYSNVVDAGGADAFAESGLEVERNNVDVLTSDVTSDTHFGDQMNGTVLGTFGETISDIGMLSFDVILAPNGGMATVGGTHQWEGAVFADPGNSNVDIGVDITIDSVACSGPCVVTPVPLPGAALLFGSGLSGLAFLGLRRRRQQRRAA